MNPLEVILATQNGSVPHFADYGVAEHEIRRGAKRSCWMWYIWPSMGTVRQHRMPSMLLTFPQHIEYLEHEVLGRRLLEITRIANQHLLQKGRHRVSREILFGGSLDGLKFHETCTVFAVAALSAGNEEAAAVFTESLLACGGMNAKVVEALLKDGTCREARTRMNQIQENLSSMKASSKKGVPCITLLKEKLTRQSKSPPKKKRAVNNDVAVAHDSKEHASSDAGFPSDEEENHATPQSLCTAASSK